MHEPAERDGITATVIFDPRNTSQTVPTDSLLLRDKNGVEYMAIVDCESFKTIAVTVNGGQFNCGDTVEADYGGATIPAVVRRAEAQPGGEWNLVLRWGQ